MEMLKSLLELFLTVERARPIMVTIAVIVVGAPVSLLFMLATMPKHNGGENGLPKPGGL